MMRILELLLTGSKRFPGNQSDFLGMACDASKWRALFLFMTVVGWGWEVSDGLGTFGFDVRHRFSDRIKEVLGFDDLPEKDSLDYYKALVHRDRLLRGRRLQSSKDQTPITFAEGNETLRIDPLAFLHYANVTVGTPPKWFLVALDTGSDLFWLPCDCTSCAKSLQLRRGGTLDLNIYSPRESTTSSNVTCNSTMCWQRRQNGCPSDLGGCPYQIRYLSANTSSSGILVEDVLHLITQNKSSKDADARITLGRGQVQTGGFLRSGAVNGLFGLGLEDYSVPTILAKAGIASNSFSMCFGQDGSGRISFGDEGTSNQSETPLHPTLLRPTYNISVTRISVGGKENAVEFYALFDTGTSFTYFMEPQYTLITQSFDKAAQDRRLPPDPDMLFEFCYELSNPNFVEYPDIVLTMQGENLYPLYLPILALSLDGGYAYCLAVLRSEDFTINIIGQNFMTGYRIVFDRERMILGWKESDCYNDSSMTTLPLPPLAPDDNKTSPNLRDGPLEGVSSPLMNPLPSAALTLLLSVWTLF